MKSAPGIGAAQNRRQQRQHQELLSMRKHRSLDGSQFLQHHLDGSSNGYCPVVSSSGTIGVQDYRNFGSYQYNLQANNSSSMPQQSQYLRQRSTYMPYSDGENLFSSSYGQSSSAFRPFQSASNYGMESEVEMLKRELMATDQKLGYVMNNIQTFWSPELKKERQMRKEEALRTNALQYKLCQQAAEIQLVRDELEKREKEIGQLLSESDLGDMEEELRRLRKQLKEPRDFTDKSLSVHELQTIKTRMERSELTLSEKDRDLHSCEVRLKCAEEQNNELEKRNEILARSNAVNEGQLKLLHDDLDVLRRKLETKNQLVENREKNVKGLEKDLDISKNQIQELVQNRQENEQRISSLAHRIDQLETLLRERDAQIDRLKQKLIQLPGNRFEKELQLRAENAEHDKSNLEKMLETLKQNTEVDKQNQLQTFQEESRHLHKTIDYLQKELTDRTMLIASQNEKISQLDTDSKSVELTKSEEKAKNDSISKSESLIQELEETRNEVERLLRIIKNMEKEKNQLVLRLSEGNQDKNGTNESLVRTEKLLESSLGRDENNGTLRLRIEELEEALRESVGITSERDKQITEQKQLVQQLSAQVNELYKLSGSRVDQKALQSATSKADTLQKMMEEERLKFQRQLTNLRHDEYFRKEVGMELIKEKDACIQLLHSPPDSIKEKIEILVRQKEQLKHRLLIQVNDVFSTSEGGPYLGNAWQNLGKTSASSLELSSTPYQLQQRQYGISNIYPVTSSNIPNATACPYSLANQINVAVPPHGAGLSAPASLLHYGRDDGDDDGIWA